MHAKKIVPRSLRLLYLCLLLALTSTRCGPSDEPSAPVALAPATVRWITWESSSQAEQTLMQQFRVDNPQIEFQRTTLDDGRLTHDFALGKNDKQWRSTHEASSTSMVETSNTNCPAGCRPSGAL